MLEVLTSKTQHNSQTRGRKVQTRLAIATILKGQYVVAGCHAHTQNDVCLQISTYSCFSYACFSVDNNWLAWPLLCHQLTWNMGPKRRCQNTCALRSYNARKSPGKCLLSIVCSCAAFRAISVECHSPDRTDMMSYGLELCQLVHGL